MATERQMIARLMEQSKRDEDERLKKLAEEEVQSLAPPPVQVTLRCRCRRRRRRRRRRR